jgi:hypothetical protein
MASKPETRFQKKIHKHLNASIHKEKMANQYRGGTPDVWYSGNYGDLWVEYKWISKPALKARIYVHKLLSGLQAKWLRERYSEGRNVAVILGTPVGAWVYEGGDWEGHHAPTRNTIERAGLTPVHIAEYIQTIVYQGE